MNDCMVRTDTEDVRTACLGTCTPYIVSIHARNTENSWISKHTLKNTYD